MYYVPSMYSVVRTNEVFPVHVTTSKRLHLNTFSTSSSQARLSPYRLTFPIHPPTYRVPSISIQDAAQAYDGEPAEARATPTGQANGRILIIVVGIRVGRRQRERERDAPDEAEAQAPASPGPLRW